MAPVPDRIQRGVEWLNEHFPDWLDTVNVETLDASSSLNDALAQASGVSSVKLLDWFEWDEEDFGPRPCPPLSLPTAARMGLWLTPGDTTFDSHADALTSMWKAAVEGLRASESQLVSA